MRHAAIMVSGGPGSGPGRLYSGKDMAMSAGQRSWDLKVQRAGQHLEEVREAVAAYASRNPYRAVRARQPRGQRQIWFYRLEMTEEPDPMIPVIIGECLYDLRSALDHLAVAMAPGKGRQAPPSPLRQRTLGRGMKRGTLSTATSAERASPPRARTCPPRPSR
jgi:hypothetical protein